MQNEHIASGSTSSGKAGTAAPVEIALGCMGMSGAYGKTDDAQSTAVIHAAIERGVTLLDTGDFYGSGHNELLIGKAIAGRRDQVQLSVKFGVLRGPDNSVGGIDARPAALKNFLAYSLVRLGTDYVDVYRPARLDPAVPIEDTDRCDRRPGESRLRAIDRAVRGRPRDDQARGEGASDRRSRRSSTRSRAAIRRTRSSRCSRSSASARRCTACCRAGCSRPARSAPATRAPPAAVHRGESRSERQTRRRSPGPRDALGHHAEPARDRLGARQAAAVPADARHAKDAATRRSAHRGRR